ncbi:MAG: serine hydrolase domain-containing protein [Pseudomonadota bacterium]
MSRLVLACLVCALESGALAQEETSPLVFESDAVAAWADEYFGPRVAAGVINGAAIGVIQDGNTVLLRGYGWEDMAREIPLDPQRSKIRMCSVSKTFTATAILQLRDRGLIQSLDDPVNTYLKRYQLPGPAGAAVTLRQLMTHSSGMAGHYTPQGTKLDLPVPVDAAEVASLFRENIERPPGLIGQYANLGVALESVVIEDVSGLSMADYVAQHILDPLDMNQSLMHHDTSVPEHLVQPYGVFPNGELQPVPFYPKHPLTAASGGIIAPPVDMLKYAAFHADVVNNRYANVLADASKREMQQRQFGNHPAQEGIGLHFYPQQFGPHRYVSHGCGLPGTRSNLGVFPELDAAVVISLFVASPTPALSDVIGEWFGVGRLVSPEDAPPPTELSAGAPWFDFAQHFAGPLVVATPTAGTSGPDIGGLAGTYWSERRSFHSVAALFGSSATIEVQVTGPTTLQIRGREATQVAPGVFDHEHRRYVFRQVGEHLYLHLGASSSYRRFTGLSNPGTAMAGLLLGMVLLGTLVLVPIWPKRTAVQRRIRALGWLGLGLIIALPFSVLVGYDTVGDFAFIDYFNGDLTRTVIITLLLNLIALVGVGFVVAALFAWQGSGGWRLQLWRGQVTLLALGALASWPAYVVFNVLGLQL